MDPIHRAVIIAAGRGSRLASAGPKPLVELGGKALVFHVMDSLARAGIRTFTLVLGYQADRIARRVIPRAAGLGYALSIRHNPDWRQANGRSVLRAEPDGVDPFVLTMCDHLYPPGLVSGLLDCGLGDCDLRLAVDRRIRDNPLVDLDDVTRVQTNGDRLTGIGKGLVTYDAFDTGVFLAGPALFRALEASIAEGDDSLSGGVRRLARAGRAGVFDIGDRSWIDVDDEAALVKAEKRLTPDGWGAYDQD